jgi:glycosyltransferase involved in cell wall biosynthesis
MKNIVCVIDTLNSGGAQRQMVKLINFLIKNDSYVHLFVIHPIYNIENNIVNSQNLIFEKNSHNGYLSTFKSLYKLTKSETNYKFISFLNGPNYLLIFLKLLRPKTFICISERRGYNSKLSFLQSLKYFPYSIANIVLFNSKDTFEKIIKYCFPLKFNSKIIYNLTNEEYIQNKLMVETRFSFIANYRYEKNHTLLFNTLMKYKQNLNGINVSCYGNNFYVGNKATKNSIYYDTLIKRLSSDQLNSHITLNNQIDNVSEVYLKSEFLLLLSNYEGFPNVVCEAMMYGLIIITTNVSDVDDFIIHKTNGYILKDSSPKELYKALDWALNLSIDDRLVASKINNKIALNNFANNKNGQKYLDELFF